jgi:hypothetical protein
MLFQKLRPILANYTHISTDEEDIIVLHYFKCDLELIDEMNIVLLASMLKYINTL